MKSCILKLVKIPLVLLILTAKAKPLDTPYSKGKLSNILADVGTSIRDGWAGQRSDLPPHRPGGESLLDRWVQG